MSEIIGAYFCGVLTIPITEYLIIPFVKKKLRERWENQEENDRSERRRGRPKGSKNKPKEGKKE